MADGIGCTCAAWSANECCCGIDWTPKELIELRERCAFYERTNAEQAAILNRVIAERDDYRAALEEVLDTRNAEAKAQLSYDVANENYTDPKPESEAWGKAMIAASAAEKKARELLAKHSPEDEIERARRMV